MKNKLVKIFAIIGSVTAIVGTMAYIFRKKM